MTQQRNVTLTNTVDAVEMRAALKDCFFKSGLDNPIVNNAMITVADGLVLVEGTDLSNAVKRSMWGDQEERGTAQVQIAHADLKAIFAKIKGNVHLEFGYTDGDPYLAINHQRKEWFLPSEPTDKAPPYFPMNTAEKRFVVPAHVFMPALKAHGLIRCDERARYCLGGTHFVVGSGYVDLTSTDGRRLQTDSIPGSIGGPGDTVLIHGNLLDRVAASAVFKKAGSAQVTVEWDGSRVWIEVCGQEFAATLPKDEFPPVEKLLEKTAGQDTDWFKAEKTHLLEAVEAVCGFHGMVGDKAGLMTLATDLSVSVAAEERDDGRGFECGVVGGVTDEIDRKIEGSYNSYYLQAAIKACPGTYCYFRQATGGMVQVANDYRDPSYRHIVMPMTVQGGEVEEEETESAEQAA